MNNRESAALTVMKDSLRLYEGDTRIRDEDGNLCSRRSKDLLYGDKEAYRTLNALLFSGIFNEYSRIFKEKHKLNPVFLERLEETIEIYCNIFRLMLGDREAEDTEMIVRRVERQGSVEMLKLGRTVSFVSASRGGYDQEFADKDGVVLLEIHAKSHVPHLDFEKTLGKEYGCAGEREVLFPPFMDLEMEEVSMSSGEKKSVRDKNNRPPSAKYRVEMKGFSCTSVLCPELCLLEDMESEVMKGKAAAAWAVEAMMRGEWDNDFSDYILWKEQFQKYLRGRFFQMWKEGTPGQGGGLGIK